jgi:hypothetical protein
MISKMTLELLIRKLKKVGRKLGIIPNKKPLKLLISGNTFHKWENMESLSKKKKIKK